MADTHPADAGAAEAEVRRRQFIKLCGTLSLYTPPMIGLLLAPGQDAIAQSGIVVDSDGVSDN